MRIEFTNDDMTEARLVRGFWWWKRCMRLKRLRRHTWQALDLSDPSAAPDEVYILGDEDARDIEVKREWAHIWRELP